MGTKKIIIKKGEILSYSLKESSKQWRPSTHHLINLFRANTNFTQLGLNICKILNAGGASPTNCIPIPISYHKRMQAFQHTQKALLLRSLNPVHPALPLQ